MYVYSYSTEDAAFRMYVSEGDLSSSNALDNFLIFSQGYKAVIPKYDPKEKTYYVY